MMHPDDSLDEARHRALKIGISDSVGVFVLVLEVVIGAMILGYAPPLGANAGERGAALGTGSMLMGFWSSLIAWGIARLVIRIKFGRW